MKIKTIPIVIAIFLFQNIPAWATAIGIAGPGLVLLPPGTVTGAQVEGSSSDACLMFDQDLDADGNGFASASDSCMGTNGTESSGFAFAKSPGLLPAITTTFAATNAGVGESSDALAEATAGGKVSFSGVTNGGFDIDIDPFIVTEGNASGSMSFSLTFRNTLVFSAMALLDQGVLTTTGEFSDSDFSVIVEGQTTIAELTNTHFFVPFTIGSNDVGKELSFEFTQVFSVNSQNGGFSQVAIPEPSTCLLLAVGIAGLFGSRRTGLGRAVSILKPA
jgi:PEP-CTERM motif-containing protein